MGNNAFVDFYNFASRIIAFGLRLYAATVGYQDQLLNKAPYGKCSTKPNALEWLNGKNGTIADQTCIEWGGLRRCWYYYVSERAIDRSVNVPLIVHLHGAGGCASLPAVGWGTIADDAGLVVVWPQGTEHPLPTAPGFLPDFLKDLLGLSVTCWNDGTGLFGAETAGIDDVGFLEAMLSELFFTVPVSIDVKRVYMMGHSNGATMAQRFALQTNGLLAGVVAISGSAMPNDPMWTPGGHVSVDYKPTSIALVHGSKDGIVPYDERRRALAGAEASFDGWGRVNGCENGTRIVDDFGDYKQYQYTKCKNATQVSLFKIQGQGHHPFPRGAEPWAISSLNVIASKCGG
jgi:polyhydroxybutyrate depolymerase